MQTKKAAPFDASNSTQQQLKGPDELQKKIDDYKKIKRNLINIGKAFELPFSSREKKNMGFLNTPLKHLPHFRYNTLEAGDPGK